jgi:hypothetical protein
MMFFFKKVTEFFCEKDIVTCVGNKKDPSDGVSTAESTGTEYLVTTNKDSIEDVNVNTSHSIEVS